MRRTSSRTTWARATSRIRAMHGTAWEPRMLLHVVHETRYDYSPVVKTAQHMAHHKPAHNAQQRLLSHQLTISPTPAQQGEAIDVYGNTRAFFSLDAMHRKLKVMAESLVSTSKPRMPQDGTPWEEARE